MAGVGEEEVAFGFFFERNFEHGGGDVESDPFVAVFGDNFAGEARAAANIEQEGGLAVFGQHEEFDGSFGHFCLNCLHSCTAKPNEVLMVSKRATFTLGERGEVRVGLTWRCISAPRYRCRRSLEGPGAPVATSCVSIFLSTALLCVSKEKG